MNVKYNTEEKSPGQKEREKTKTERASDIAYTTNHALVCTATDFIDPYIGNAIQKKLGNKSQLANIWTAEVIGDFAAIPATIGMQRFFPGVMTAISKFVEPVFHKAFENGAKRDGKAWVKRHFYEVGSKEYNEYVKNIYNYEVAHIPQALMWTVSSVAINVAAQRAFGNKAPIAHIGLGKIGGAVLTAGLTVGGRAIFPRNAEKFDKFTSENFLLPLEEKIDGVAGDAENGKEWSKLMTISKKKETGYKGLG